jgi:hypothetical protein
MNETDSGVLKLAHPKCLFIARRKIKNPRALGKVEARRLLQGKKITARFYEKL